MDESKSFADSNLCQMLIGNKMDLDDKLLFFISPLLFSIFNCCFISYFYC